MIEHSISPEAIPLVASLEIEPSEACRYSRRSSSEKTCQVKRRDAEARPTLICPNPASLARQRHRWLLEAISLTRQKQSITASQAFLDKTIK